MHVIPNSQILQVQSDQGLGRHQSGHFGRLCQNLADDPAFGPNLTTTPTAMRVSDLGDHGVDICIREHTRPGEQWGLTGALCKRIKNRFDEVGVEIPWPHTKVYFGNTPEVAYGSTA